MLKLGIAREPRWINLPGGVRLFLKPCNTTAVQAARLLARRQLGEAQAAYDAARDTGLPFEGMALDDDLRRTAMLFGLTVVALARELVLDWDGVGDDSGAPLAFDAQRLPELLAFNGLAESFWDQAASLHTALTTEGNA